MCWRRQESLYQFSQRELLHLIYLPLISKGKSMKQFFQSFRFSHHSAVFTFTSMISLWASSQETFFSIIPELFTLDFLWKSCRRKNRPNSYRLSRDRNELNTILRLWWVRTMSDIFQYLGLGPISFPFFAVYHSTGVWQHNMHNSYAVGPLPFRICSFVCTLGAKLILQCPLVGHNSGQCLSHYM